MKDRLDVLEWLKKAENDYKAACDLAERKDDPLSDLVCFHCQQAIEKYLKAFLVLKNTIPPRTHDLDTLLDLCSEEEPSFDNIREIVSPLSLYAVEYRYPGESAIVAEEEDALIKTKEIRLFVKEKLEIDL